MRNDISEERCDRLNSAASAARAKAAEAIFASVYADSNAPDDDDKCVASTAAMVAVFEAAVEGAAEPEFQMQRRLILRMVERSIAPKIARLYEIENGHA